MIHNRNVMEEITPVFNKPTLSTASLQEEYIQHKNQSGIVTVISYINNLPIAVVVSDRSGMKSTVQPTPDAYQHYFLVVKKFTIHRDSFNDVMESVKAIPDDDINNPLIPIRDAFYARLNEMGNVYNGGSISFSTITKLSIDNFKQNNGVVYDSGNDVVLSIRSFSDTPNHKFTESRGSYSSSFNEGENTNVAIEYEMIDNTGRMGNRFVSVCKNVLTLVPKKDEMRQDGVWVSYTRRDYTTKDGMVKVKQLVPFELCERDLNIYQTHEGAFTNGDRNLTRKEELIKMEHEMKVKNQEDLAQLHQQRIEIAQLDNKNIERKRELEDFKNKLEKEALERKNEADNIKHELDTKSIELKHTKEIAEREFKAQQDKLEQEQLAVKNEHNQRMLELKIEQDKREQKHLEEMLEKKAAAARQEQEAATLKMEYQKKLDEATARAKLDDEEIKRKDAKITHTNNLIKLAVAITTAGVALVGLFAKLKMSK